MRQGTPRVSEAFAPEENYRLLAEHASDVVVGGDANGIVRSATPSVTPLVGWQPVEMVGRPFISFVHPEDAGLVLAVQARVSRGEVATFEARVRTASGGHRWIAISVRPEFDEHGVITGRVAGWHDVEAAIETRRSLLRSEERFRLLANHATDIVCLAGPDHRLTWIAPSMTRTLGWVPEELVGTTIAGLVHPDDHMHTDPESGQELLVRLRTSTGAHRWMSGTVSHVIGEEGEVIGTVTGWRDVDRLVAAQQEAETERARLRATLDSLLDPHVLLQAVRDDSGTIVDFVYIDANHAALVYNGLSREDLIGSNLLDLLPGHAETGKLQRYIDAVETGVPLVLDGYVYDQELLGDERVYDVRAVKVGDALSYTFRDVTDAWQVRHDLEESVAVRQRMGEIARISGSEVDLRTGKRTWLPESLAILDLDELPGPDVGLHDFLSPESLTIVQAAVEEGIANGATWNVEVPAVTAKGRDIWLRILGSADIEDGVPTILHGAFQDITELKRAEAERSSLEAQLRQAAKTESVGRLAGGVAHDFNNMLGVILGRSELALSRLDPSDPVQADLNEIHRAAQRSAGLTQQLLAFARQQTVEPKLMDLNRVVAGMLGMLHRLIGEDVPVVWHPDGEVWPIRIDPSQIDQVVTNLCLNGRDAIIESGRSNGVVEITTTNVVIDEAFCNRHPEAQPGEFVRLSVADNGDGMTPEIAAQIFEPFFTTKDIGSGTGLGLATVHGAVTQNDGFVVVSSQPGVGTTFQVHLPRQIVTSELDPGATPMPKLRRGKETVLVVEDEPSMLRLIARVLVAHDYEVLSAGGVCEAIELAGTHADDIQLVVTDVVMPNVNGRELVETLTSLGLRARHLFMSGYPADVIARRGVLDTGVAFIQKPFSMDDLLAKIGEVLDRPDE